MSNKLHISLIIINLVVLNPLKIKNYMHNLYANFVKILEVSKQFSRELVNEKGNIPRCGVVPRFSDLEVVALSLTAESLSIDSENCLFEKLKEYRQEFPNLISRRQYNDRRKFTADLYNKIRADVAGKIDGGEDYFCIDSKPIEICRIARSKRCTMGRDDLEKAPNYGFCASQNQYYYGYKLHALCGLSGVIHSFDLTGASVHDIKYLQDVKYEYHDCTILGDRGYISREVQLDLFETALIKLEVPHRLNQKDWKPYFPPFRKARKRIETSFSQLDDQFMLFRNYAKATTGFFTRIISKISAFTFSQYFNFLNNRPIGQVKYALT